MMGITFTYNGLPLKKLPELVGKSRKDFIEELNSHNIECEYSTYTRWISTDIKLSVLVTICNMYHLPIFYFFNRDGYEYRDIEYQLQENWTDIVPQYKVLGESIQRKYGSIRRACRMEIISTSMGTYMLNGNSEKLDALMVSKFIYIINRTQINLVSILPDSNIPFRKDHVTKSYKNTLPGYDDVVMASEPVEEPYAYSYEVYQLQMANNSLKQQLLDEKSENFRLRRQLETLRKRFFKRQ